jgi:hypothetical protein
MGKPTCHAVPLIGAQGTPELILSGSKIRRCPSPTFIFGVIVETNPEVSKWSEGLKHSGAFHESRVPETADRFQRERMLPLANANGSQGTSVFEVNP